MKHEFLKLYLVYFEHFDTEESSVIGNKVIAVTTSLKKANELANDYIRTCFFNDPYITGEWEDQTITYLNERIEFDDGPWHYTVTIEETTADEFTREAKAEIDLMYFDD